MKLETVFLIGFMMMFLGAGCGQQKALPQGFSTAQASPSTQLPTSQPPVIKPLPKASSEGATSTTVLNTTTTTIAVTTTTTIAQVEPKENPNVEPKANPNAEPKANPNAEPKANPNAEPKVQNAEIQMLPGMLESDFEKKGEAIPTVYYKARYELAKQTCEDQQKLPILDLNDDVLVQLCPRAHADCLLQGSCMIVDEDGLSTSINYVRNINKIPRFVEIDSQRCPFGLGVQNLCLDPFFTVAADMNFFRPGEVLYVPSLVGVVLPKGIKHHGFLVVRDRGGGIKGDHRFDFFTGFFHYSDGQNPFLKLGFQDQKNRFPYYKVNGISAELVLKKRGYPELP